MTTTLLQDSLSRLAVGRDHAGHVLVQSRNDRRQRHQNNAITEKTYPADSLSTSGWMRVSAMLLAVCGVVERDEVWFGGEVEVDGLGGGVGGDSG